MVSALIVQWLECNPSKVVTRVRFPLNAILLYCLTARILGFHPRGRGSIPRIGKIGVVKRHFIFFAVHHFGSRYMSGLEMYLFQSS